MQNYPPNILVDAGPLIALYRQRDKHHRRVIEFAGTCRSDLFTTWPVLTEAAHFLNERRADFGIYRTRSTRAFVNHF